MGTPSEPTFGLAGNYGSFKNQQTARQCVSLRFQGALGRYQGNPQGRVGDFQSRTEDLMGHCQNLLRDSRLCVD